MIFCVVKQFLATLRQSKRAAFPKIRGSVTPSNREMRDANRSGKAFEGI